ncbi:MAG TPA: FtsW/RodA/SpoVE family cell cycle protein [Candidatus Paceibacterota bacterium]
MFRVSSSKQGRKADHLILAIVAILILAGLIFLATTASDPAEKLQEQLYKGILPGLFLFTICSFIPYQKYKPFAFYLLIFNVFLLCVIFVPALGLTQQSGGAARWIKIGPINFQPSELLKITLVLYLAAWFSNAKMERAKNVLKGLLPFGIICGLITVLLYFQPATSMILILIFSGGAMYFLSNPPWRHVLFVIAFIAGLGLLATLLFLSDPSSHRAKRIKTYLDPGQDALGSGYQANQARIAIGSGGIFGSGYGQDSGRVYVPKSDNDLIFSSIAQQTGFAGAGFIVVLFAILVARLFWLAKKVRDRFGALILGGFASVFALQSFFHMAANSGMIPLTGLPLPFISLGGTSMVVSLIMMGITVNISKYSN